MALNPTMLEELKNIIYNESKLPESVKDPIHITVKVLASLEYSYEDFLSRQKVGETVRANIVRELIDSHGGDSAAFTKWFDGYELGDSQTGLRSAWGS
jgi:hypothetical protein